MPNNQEQIDRLSDVLLSRAREFKVKNRRFALYPITLGKNLILAKVADKLKFSHLIKVNTTLEVMRLCTEHTDDVCKLIAYHTMCDKNGILSGDKTTKRAEFFKQNLSIEEISTLFLSLPNSETEDIEKFLGLDEERAERKRITEYKNQDGNGMSKVFGGKSIYGGIIDWACQRYGWTLNYVLWGISYANLKLLMADSVNDIYLTKEDMAKLHITNNDTVVDGDNKEAVMQFIKSHKWD
jgi:hypothetical protein